MRERRVYGIRTKNVDANTRVSILALRLHLRFVRLGNRDRDVRANRRGPSRHASILVLEKFPISRLIRESEAYLPLRANRARNGTLRASGVEMDQT